MATNITLKIRAALDDSLNTEALDLVNQAAEDGLRADEICYLGALACSRMGAMDQAEQRLAAIDRDALDDEDLAVEIWGLAGRIAKARFAIARERAGNDQQARYEAAGAIACYERAFNLGGAAYPAVNAATLAMITGDLSRAETLARAALAAPGQDRDPWHQATLGEASLILREIDVARKHYAEAHRLAGTQFGLIASMRRQLLLIGSDVALDLLASVPAPEIIAFSGHMIDRPNRPVPRFPADIEDKVAHALRARLRRGPSIGFGQAACGADILFLEAMQELGMQTHIVLPFAKDDFIAESVAVAGQMWVARFQAVLDRATRIVRATEDPFLGDEVLFEHAANLVQGLAFLQAGELSTTPLMLTLLDPDSPSILGGTMSSARIWRDRGGPVENIDLAGIRGATPAGAIAATSPAGSAASPSTSQRHLMSLLFADISGFSRMPEQHTPQFVSVFLGICAQILDSLRYHAVDANTRGDALYLVFERPGHAAEYAVRLAAAMAEIDYPAFGLSPDTGVRIGLHTGPVFRIQDPVMGKPTFYGTHVNLAARLEPVVQVDQVFVTEAFAASLVAEGAGSFRCHYIGDLPLAKQFGSMRLFRLDS